MPINIKLIPALIFVLVAFDESVYDRIYQVVISGGGGRIHILHQNFSCSTQQP